MLCSCLFKNNKQLRKRKKKWSLQLPPSLFGYAEVKQFSKELLHATSPLPWGRSPTLRVLLHHQRGCLAHVILTNSKLVANTSSNVYTALAPSRKGTYRQLPLCLKLRIPWHPQEVTILSYRLCVLGWLILTPSVCPLPQSFWGAFKAFDFACCCFFTNKHFVLFYCSTKVEKKCYGKVNALHFGGLKVKLIRQAGKTYISDSKGLFF